MLGVVDHGAAFLVTWHFYKRSIPELETVHTLPKIACAFIIRGVCMNIHNEVIITTSIY